MILNMLRKPTRYLHLSGDPVGYPKPVKILLRGEFMVAALMAASFGLTANKYDETGSIVGGATGVIITATWRKRDGKKFETAFGSQVIDKLPTEHAKAASYKQRLLFQNASSTYRTGALIEAGLVGLGISFTITGPDLSAVTTVMGCYGAYYTSQAFNFNKLAKGEWALTDEPPKDKAFDHLKSKAPEIKLAPQAA